MTKRIFAMVLLMVSSVTPAIAHPRHHRGGDIHDRGEIYRYSHRPAVERRVVRSRRRPFRRDVITSHRRPVERRVVRSRRRPFRRDVITSYRRPVERRLVRSRRRPFERDVITSYRRPVQSRYRPEPRGTQVSRADTNSCVEGSVIGGLLGAGIGAVLSKGEGRWIGVPLGGAAGALVGCQVDGG